MNHVMYPEMLWLLLLPIVFRYILPAAKGLHGDALKVPFLRDLEQINIKAGGLWNMRAHDEAKIAMPLVLVYMIWALLVLAAARPQWVGEPMRLPGMSRDILLVVDISNSMREPDFTLGNRRIDRLTAIKKTASEFIKKRVWKCYRRKADVIYPPVDVKAFEFCDKKEDFYLTASRMVPYKKMDLIVEAFTKMPDKKLIVIGDGPDFSKIQKIAEGNSNIKLMGYQPFKVLKEHMQKAKAFVFVAEEDFGITPVEAQACGTPVIAYGRGGALETVRGLDIKDKPTGIFFYEQDKNSLIKTINYFEENKKKIQFKDCRENALSFSIDNFKNILKKYVSNKLYGIDKNEEDIY